MDSDHENDILKIIEKLTITGRKTLDEGLMKKLKGTCKKSDKFVSYAYYVLMTKLRKEHSEVRYSTLLIINELFCRSSVFRKLLETDLEEFMELVTETNPENPLPLPQVRAKELKLKGLEFMQAWSNKFGEKYVRFQLALAFLKNCKKVDFNDMHARDVAQRQREQQEQEKRDRILNEKIAKIKSEMQEVSGEISNIHLQMENCFRLLVPALTEDLFSGEDFNTAEQSDSDSEEQEGSFSSSLRHHGIYDMKEAITIKMTEKPEVSVKANDDTLPVIDSLNDLYKQLSSRYFPMVTGWLKTLTKGSNCTDDLKRAIDLKNIIESAFGKYKELKINQDLPDFDDENEDDDFEEVIDKEGFEAEAFKETNMSPSSSQPSCSKAFTSVEKAFMWKLRHSKDDAIDPTSAASTLSKRKMKCKGLIPSTSFPVKQKEDAVTEKSKLLEQAPVLPYDIDLFHWEEEKLLVPERVKFDALHNFWESRNDDDENEALKEAQIASLRTRKIDFSGTFEPVKFACRAPLSNGKLCPRMDRFKCPFHGKIIKRDPCGTPVSNLDTGGASSSAASVPEVPEWQDPNLLRDIEAATGINLKMPQKKGKGKRTKQEGGLTNIKKMQTNTRDRLSKKIIKRYKHYAKKLDDMERKKFNDKFGDQWNYY